MKLPIGYSRSPIRPLRCFKHGNIIHRIKATEGFVVADKYFMVEQESGMAAKPVYDSRVWIEDEQLVRDGVDGRTLEVLLGDGLLKQLDRRGSATRLKFRAVYDTKGRYEVSAVLVRAEGGVVVVLHEDLYRPGDLFYIDMNRKIVKFTVTEVRRGSRPDDDPSTRILRLALVS